uniref:Vta1/callose synthase N-terminal domain-containing protein n=1 Tax=Eucampia antarctica TaxID=49252 RepID=A0A7S2R0K1_9STRA|mmetsp:Transcript_12163/g.11724  ORF Transcript_12163/g.11724 Transcript_12163/m.11724 type:complete len:363 (+) Transcript_12163:64-1152(+)|eukprot:CAMPEP_0197825602 /NCGR_PEP_ID=MMETSP1437-20131217/2656_1 /TAXON_ID=49252 ORGANISM="Eucampia antarctica, Strain CCMP1452" /NCGR_SAMPLE_ID=MMETSP1437 /ASSEMBLY_ACC=CAM_ASM_001096 /LENGTH=362 /DNA_ID=CAMNT_0043425669 /DNA_START=35 /DNA_END=1123 /DNA_ORIENTATION=-
MPLKVPPELKKITQFVRRAEELDSESSPESRVVSYYSRQYAVQMGLPLAGSTPKAKECLAGLLSELEKDKAAMGVFSREESRMICRAFADKVFERANGPDRIGMADKSTARTFYAAATFYEILLQFYPQTVVVVGVDDDVDAKEESQIEEDEKRVYCKWKATDILKAIREGRKPVAGGYLDKEAEEVEETLVTEEESKESFEVMPSAPSFHQNKSDSEDEEAEVEVGTEVLLDSYKKDHSFNPNNNNNNNKRTNSTPPPYSVVVEEVDSSSSSDEEVYAPPPPKPTIPKPRPPPPTTNTTQPSKKNMFGLKKNKSSSKGKVSKAVLADATELTKFALKALKEKDTELAAERLSQALEVLHNQ